MADINKELKEEHLEPVPPGEEHEHKTERRSSMSKIIDAVKKPFHHTHKEKENPPALQDAIDKMEERRERTKAEMERDGKDPNVLSSNKKDILKSEASKYKSLENGFAHGLT